MTMRCIMAIALPVLLTAAPAAAVLDPLPIEADEPEETKVQTDNYTFLYSYSKALAREPGLARYLRQQGKEELAKFSADADRDHVDWAANPKNTSELWPYDYNIHWQQQAEVPAFISLLQNWYGFYGGAHGIFGTKSLLWDKSNEQMIEPLKLFRSAKAFDRALQSEFCTQLDSARAEKRGQPISAERDGIFEDCLIPSEYTLILGSRKGSHFDTVTINIGPYAAGPYSEGQYEIDLSVTEAIIGAVKPAYRDSFRINR